jgi:hypothetical protein
MLQRDQGTSRVHEEFQASPTMSSVVDHRFHHHPE